MTARNEPATQTAWRRLWTSPSLPEAGSLDGEQVQAAAGRGTIAKVTLSGRAAIVRTYRRGGALRSLLPDAFVSSQRALREVAALERLSALGLSPEPLALEARGLGLVSLRIAIEEVAGAANLVEIARLSSRLDPALARRVGDVVRRMHEAGVSHPDLAAGNVLVAGGAVHVIDLDGARLFDERVPVARRHREVLRFCRSLDKWEATSRASAAARGAFLRAALPPDERLAVLRRARRLHAMRSRLGRRPR